MINTRLAPSLILYPSPPPAPRRSDVRGGKLVHTGWSCCLGCSGVGGAYSAWNGGNDSFSSVSQAEGVRAAWLNRFSCNVTVREGRLQGWTEVLLILYPGTVLQWNTFNVPHQMLHTLSIVLRLPVIFPFAFSSFLCSKFPFLSKHTAFCLLSSQGFADILPWKAFHPKWPLSD